MCEASRKPSVDWPHLAADSLKLASCDIGTKELAVAREDGTVLIDDETELSIHLSPSCQAGLKHRQPAIRDTGLSFEIRLQNWVAKEERPMQVPPLVEQQYKMETYCGKVKVNSQRLFVRIISRGPGLKATGGTAT